MFAKRFFYVCAGLFLLALTYHFGTSNAGAAKSGVTIDGANIDGSVGGYAYTCAVGRTFHLGLNAPGASVISAPIPGIGRVVTTGSVPQGPAAVLENGDVYAWTGGFSNPSVGSWQLVGNMLAGQ